MIMPGVAYETSSGGPFMRDINGQTSDDEQELYWYMNSGHVRTEPWRFGLMGPYAMTFTYVRRYMIKNHDSGISLTSSPTQATVAQPLQISILLSSAVSTSRAMSPPLSEDLSQGLHPACRRASRASCTGTTMQPSIGLMLIQPLAHTNRP